MLAKSIRAHDQSAVAPGPLAESVSEATASSRHACPQCRSSLQQHRLSERNPLEIEICPECFGVWLPHGEMERAQAGHQLRDAQAAIGADRSWGQWFFQLVAGLPVEFNVQPRKTPWVTYTLIALCAVIFNAVELGLAYGPANLPIVEYFMALMLDPSEMGELHWYASLISSQFLHGNLIHLIGNMYFLWILGDNVEDVLGPVWFLLFYLAAGAVAGAVYSAFEFPSATHALGASGAISGVMGAYAVIFRRSKLTFMLILWQFKLAAPVYIGIWALFNLGGWIAKSPGVAWEAHLGGLIFGLIVGLVSYRTLLRQRPLLRLLNGVAGVRLQHPQG